MTQRWFQRELALKHAADDAAGFWFGYTLPGVRRAIEQADWQPIDRELYCHRCGSLIGEGEPRMKCRGAKVLGCRLCVSRRFSYQEFVRLGSYEGPLKEWITDVKYRGWAEMALTLGDLLGAEILQNGCNRPGEAVVVPMPMPWLRRVQRGIDHAGLIAEAVARRLNAPLVCLLSKRNGPPQVALPAGRRLVNLRRRISIRKRSVFKGLEGTTLILVDDVRSTGTTIQAAARALRTLRPRAIVVAVLAVNDGPARRVAAELFGFDIEAKGGGGRVEKPILEAVQGRFSPG